MRRGSRGTAPATTSSTWTTPRKRRAAPPPEHSSCSVDAPSPRTTLTTQRMDASNTPSFDWWSSPVLPEPRRAAAGSRHRGDDAASAPDARDRLVARREDLEQPVEAGDLEQ